MLQRSERLDVVALKSEELAYESRRLVSCVCVLVCVRACVNACVRACACSCLCLCCFAYCYVCAKHLIAWVRLCMGA